MSGILSEKELKLAVENNSFIKNGDIANCEGLKYDFRVSNRVLRADFSRPLEFKTANANEQEKLVIEPGEVAFVMTEETLDLPNNIFCQLSSKRKLSHGGIIILGGFTVDPNYKGKLIFGLYNISSRKYPIIPGKKLVAGIFYQLESTEISEKPLVPEAINDFPDDLLAMIKEYKPLVDSSIAALSDNMNSMKDEIRNLKERLDEDKKWSDEFKRGLTENNAQIKALGEQISTLTENLQLEADERKKETSSLREKLGQNKIIGTALVSIVSLLLGGLISVALTMLFS